MAAEEPKKRKTDPYRMQMLRSLPVEVKQSLTREEADAFLYEDVWPDSLQEKLRDYLQEGEAGNEGPAGPSS